MREVVHFQDSPFANYIEDEGIQTDFSDLMPVVQQKEHVEVIESPKTSRPKSFTFEKLKSVFKNLQEPYFERFLLNGTSFESLQATHLKSKGNVYISGFIGLGILLIFVYFGCTYLWNLLYTLSSATLLLFLCSRKKDSNKFYRAFLLNMYHGNSIIYSLKYLEYLQKRSSDFTKETKKTIHFLRELESSSMFFRLAGHCDSSSMEYRILEEKILAKQLRISLVQRLLDYVQLFIETLETLNSKEVTMYKEQLSLYKNAKLREIETSKISLGVLNDFLYLAQAIELDFFDALKFKFTTYRKPTYPKVLEILAMLKKLQKESQDLVELVQRDLYTTKSSELLTPSLLEPKPKEIRQEKAGLTSDRSVKALKTLKAFLTTVKEDQKKFKRHLEFLFRIIDSDIYSSEEKCEQILHTIEFVRNFYKELMDSNLKTFGPLTKIFSEINETKKKDPNIQQQQLSSNNQSERAEGQMDSELQESAISENHEESHPKKDMILEAEANPDEIEVPRVKVIADSSKKKIEELNAVMGELQGAFLRKNISENTIINKKVDKHGKSSIEIIKEPQHKRTVDKNVLSLEKTDNEEVKLAENEKNYVISQSKPNLFAFDFRNQFMNEIKNMSSKIQKDEKTFE